MKPASLCLVAATLLAGCASLQPPPPAPGPDRTASRADEPASPLGSPFHEARDDWSSLAAPLLIDRTDLRLGTTVQYRRVPEPGELHDLTLLPGLARIVMSFDSWPKEYAPLEVLNSAPEGVEIVAILPGWPPTRAAAEAWNYLHVPLRIVVVVPGPPPSLTEVTSLNSMRGLERVIAQMDEPSRSGFERLQRPLSFRKLVP